MVKLNRYACHLFKCFRLKINVVTQLKKKQNMIVEENSCFPLHHSIPHIQLNYTHNPLIPSDEGLAL